MTMKRLVLLVEGEGDVEAVPALVKRLLPAEAYSSVSLDPHPLRVGGVTHVSRRDYAEWRRFLGVALKRGNVGGCLLLLDGDAGQLHGKPFCSRDIAMRLVREAHSLGAGRAFSLAVVFACMEFESWLLAGAQSLLGKDLSGGRPGLDLETPIPTGNFELAPRDAKLWFRTYLPGGYKESVDQLPLTQLVDPNEIRSKGPRSFRRLENALHELVTAIRSSTPVATPAG